MLYDFISPFYIIRLSRGEEIIYSLKEFVEKESIPSGIILGIGAMEEVEIGYFDDMAKYYKKKIFKKSVEILSLQGSISWIEEKPYIHIHCVIGDEKLRSYGGHLFSGRITATAEIYIFVLKEMVLRTKDKKEPFYLLDLKKKFLKEDL
jgi:predicted DNA-binding protein with PD1-like motif